MTRSTCEPLMRSPLEVAELLGVSESTVRRLIREGALPCVRVGRRVLVHRDVVARLAESGACRRSGPSGDVADSSVASGDIALRVTTAIV